MGLKKIQSSAQLDLLTSQRAYRPGPFELKLWFILSQFILWSDDSVYIMIGVFVEFKYYLLIYKVHHKLWGITLIYYVYYIVVWSIEGRMN